MSTDEQHLTAQRGALRAPSPLLCSHVSRYGVFDLDLSTRLPIAEAA
jgi:hypothetical protein